jgi:hypothetical protein
VSYGVKPVVEDINPPNITGSVSDVNYGVKPIVESVNQAKDLSNVSDVTYGIKPIVEGINQSDVLSGVSDVTYGVKAVVEDFDLPSPTGVSYGVKPVVEDINPPNVSNAHRGENNTVVGDIAMSGNSPQQSSPFAPQITVIVQGGADEKETNDLKGTLYDTVRELFAEFRAQELECMALKNQYAF